MGTTRIAVKNARIYKLYNISDILGQYFLYDHENDFEKKHNKRFKKK